MSWWLLLLVVFAAWMLWGIAAGFARAVAQRRAGIPERQRSGMSLAPIISVFPLGFWGAALLADTFVGPWGTTVVGWFHAALGVLFAGSITRDVWRLRTLARDAE